MLDSLGMLSGADADTRTKILDEKMAMLVRGGYPDNQIVALQKERVWWRFELIGSIALRALQQKGTLGCKTITGKTITISEFVSMLVFSMHYN